MNPIKPISWVIVTAINAIVIREGAKTADLLFALGLDPYGWLMIFGTLSIMAITFILMFGLWRLLDRGI